MAVAMIHLCDMHFSTSETLATRGKAIADAVIAELDPAHDSAALIFGGDLTCGGQPSEFDIAKGFVQTIRDELAAQLSDERVHVLIIPGNHDCNLSGDQTVRDLVLKTLSPAELTRPSVMPILLQPLHDYFAFIEKSVPEALGHSTRHPWYHAADIPTEEGRIRFHLFNTAWMSVREERANSLLFPLDAIQPPLSQADYDVSVLHHPFNWFKQPENMRPLRDKVESLSDLICLAHEHEATAYVKNACAGTSAMYVEGGALADPHKVDHCTFACAIINFGNKTCDLVYYKWLDRYFARETHDKAPQLVKNPRKLDSRHHLTDEFSRLLDDPGVPIHHPHREHITLRDVFLFPDLWELNDDHERNFRNQIRSSRVADTVFERDRVLITGGEKSGKTCLAKRLFIEARERGKVPVLLSGEALAGKKASHLRTEIRSAIEAQYLNLKPDEFEQLPNTSKVIIVDDIQQLDNNRVKRREVLNLLQANVGKLVVIGQDFLCLQELSGKGREESGLWEFDHFVIFGFGELLREEFVRKWLLLGDTQSNDTGTFDERVHATCSVINQVVRQHLIPCYPLFLIVILQQAGIGQPIMQGGSYGHLYHAIMTALLSKSSYHKISIKDKYTYLSTFAYLLYTNKQASIDARDMQEWHKSYWENIGIDMPFDRLLKDLTELSMLRADAGSIGFHYKYSYCFFVAFFVSENLHEDKVKALVHELFRKLFHVESSEIVLFLAHLSNDPLIMKEMRQTAESTFADAPAATLTDDVEKLNSLGMTISELFLPDGDADDRRKRFLEQKDENVPPTDPANVYGDRLTPLPTEELDAKTMQYMQIHAAFKTIQILGQAMRNNAGSMKLADKEAVIEQVFRLARRLLGLYLQGLNTELPSIAEELAAAIRKEEPQVSVKALVGQVNTHIFGMSELVGFVITRHVSTALGIDLLDTAIGKILSEDSALPNRVFSLAIDLDRPGRFPKDRAINMHDDAKKNEYVQTLIRLLVLHHLYLYNVRFDISQSVCAKLKIKLPATLQNQRLKLLK